MAVWASATTIGRRRRSARAGPAGAQKPAASRVRVVRLVRLGVRVARQARSGVRVVRQGVAQVGVRVESVPVGSQVPAQWVQLVELAALAESWALAEPAVLVERVPLGRRGWSES